MSERCDYAGFGPTLLDAVLEGSTGKHSRVHGPVHWAGVAAAGLTILDGTPEADPLVVLLFALLHDSMRESDVYDQKHGERAAAYARKLRDDGAFSLDEERMRTLELALERHDKGETSADPTIGACWDSDRLNLTRVGIEPKASLLSTTAARRLAGTAAPRYFSILAFAWPALFADYAAALGELPGRPVYLRFGDLPPEGRSSTGVILRECGVSVYPGIEDGGSYLLDFRRLLAGIDTRYLKGLLWRNRPLFLVEGRRVGLGGMGEPCLSDARIVREVAPCDVSALPDRPRYRALLEAWRAKRRGEDPGAIAFLEGEEPDERPLLPIVSGWADQRPPGVPSIGEQVNRMFRVELERWGVLEDYDRLKARSAKPVPRPRSPDI
nr:hypothetical protein [Actinomycetota bacterium]